MIVKATWSKSIVQTIVAIIVGIFAPVGRFSAMMVAKSTYVVVLSLVMILLSQKLDCDWNVECFVNVVVFRFVDCG